MEITYCTGANDKVTLEVPGRGFLIVGLETGENFKITVDVSKLVGPFDIVYGD